MVQHTAEGEFFFSFSPRILRLFLDQFFALIPNLVSDSTTDQVQYMNLRLKVELLCMGLDLTDSRIYGNSLCKVRSRTTIRATP